VRYPITDTKNVKGNIDFNNITSLVNNPSVAGISDTENFLRQH